MAELSAQGPIAAPYATSITQSTSPPPLRIGSIMRDQDGNEYAYVRFTTAAYSRLPVEILSDNTAQALTATGRGRIGVACANVAAADFGWVQIYGRAIMQIGMTGVSPSDAANGPTTLQTVAGKNFFVLPTSISSPAALGWVSGQAGLTSDYDYVIQGLWVASDASPGDVSGTTSATSHTGSEIAVWLNYPVIGLQNFVSTS